MYTALRVASHVDYRLVSLLCMFVCEWRLSVKCGAGVQRSSVACRRSVRQRVWSLRLVARTSTSPSTAATLRQSPAACVSWTARGALRRHSVSTRKTSSSLSSVRSFHRHATEACLPSNATHATYATLRNGTRNATSAADATVATTDSVIAIWPLPVVKLGGDPGELRSPAQIWDPPPLILDPPHFTRRSLGYRACLNAPFDLLQLFNHRAPHTKLWTKTDFSSARFDGMLYACSKLFPESDKRIV